MSSIPPVSFGVQAYPVKKSQASRPATGVAFGTTQPLRFGKASEKTTNKPEGVWDTITSFFTGILRALGRILGDTDKNGTDGNYAKYNDTWIYHSDVKDKLIARNADTEGKFVDEELGEMAKKIIMAVHKDKSSKNTGLTEDQFKNMFLPEGNPSALKDLNPIFATLSAKTGVKAAASKTETKPAVQNDPPGDPNKSVDSAGGQKDNQTTVDESQKPGEANNAEGSGAKTIGKFITPPTQEEQVKLLKTRIEKLQKQKNRSLREDRELASKTKALQSLTSKSQPQNNVPPQAFKSDAVAPLQLEITVNGQKVKITQRSVQNTLLSNLPEALKPKAHATAIALMAAFNQTPQNPAFALQQVLKLDNPSQSVSKALNALVLKLTGKPSIEYGTVTLNPLLRELNSSKTAQGKSIEETLVEKLGNVNTPVSFSDYGQTFVLSEKSIKDAFINGLPNVVINPTALKQVSEALLTTLASQPVDEALHAILETGNAKFPKFQQPFAELAKLLAGQAPQNMYTQQALQNLEKAVQKQPGFENISLLESLFLKFNKEGLSPLKQEEPSLTTNTTQVIKPYKSFKQQLIEKHLGKLGKQS